MGVRDVCPASAISQTSQAARHRREDRHPEHGFSCDGIRALPLGIVLPRVIFASTSTRAGDEYAAGLDA